jgi:DNA-binding response OmpR family regulator
MVRLVRRNLELAGYRVVTAADGLSAIALVESENPDLLVLDLNMPVMNGSAVISQLREFTWLPVIILSGRNDEADILSGLEAGADDYLQKPFSPRELVARIHSVLRRSRLVSEDYAEPIMQNGELRIDYAQHRVTLGGCEIQLTPTEYRVLATLAQEVGKTLTQEAILLRAWGAGYEQEAHLLRVNVARLRNKLGESASAQRFVVTRSGVGYIMPAISAAPVSEAAPQ